jgi:N-acetylmuramoyl-L-alanine amidase
MPRTLRRESVTHLIIHCSDSPWGDHRAISEWHRVRGFDRAGDTYCGYHYIIENGLPSYSVLKDGVRCAARDGLVVTARPACYWGCHALGFNDRSLGICLIGVRDFTTRQMDALEQTVRALCEQYDIPPANVLGHCETKLAGGKSCPNFDVAALRARLVAPVLVP